MNPAAARYHEATKHSVESLRRNPHFLDWANQPDPFRHYEGVPVLDLPADPPLHAAIADGAVFLSSLFFYSCSISATKRAPSGYRYALRVNPSSGNLHPTEFHFATRGLAGWPDGCYHYRVSSHVAEQRGLGDYLSDLTDAPLAVLLSSISWREAWKYRSRAYRYVNHDIGHAWQSLAICARFLGCDVRAHGLFLDRELARHFSLPDDEWPMLLLTFDGPGLPRGEAGIDDGRWFGGTPNRISPESIEYPLIDEIHAASSLDTLPVVASSEPCETPIGFYGEYAAISRRRRSALDFAGGDRTISIEQLRTLLSAAAAPLCADWPDRHIRLFLWVHRVDGLAPGLYSQDLQLIRAGDMRVLAAGLSLGQDLAGNSCVTFSMVADLERATRDYGARGYRIVHWEAGAIGQRFYLAAEAMGFNSTGIGAFYDDQVHRALDLAEDQGQVVYHFACGYAVRDPRLDG